MSMAITDELAAFEKQALIKVCGVGGGGGNAVGRMIEEGLTDVEFITVNTDAQALKNSPAGTRLQIGASGLGAGAKPEAGRQAAEEDRDRIADVLKGADMIFLTAGLGGGTGTGAMPVVAEVAQESGALTVGIVTLPFSFEGKERMDNALKGLAALQEHVDSLIVVPNDRLALICHESTSFLGAFRLADEVLHNGVRAISELITVPGLINLDFADVRTTMVGSGRSLMGIGTAEGDNRATRAAEEAIVCPLLEKSSIDGALGVIVNVRGGSDITMREVLNAVTVVKKAAHPTANIIFGAVLDDDDCPDIQVTVIAAGFAREHSQTLPEPESYAGTFHEPAAAAPAAKPVSAIDEQPAFVDIRTAGRDAAKPAPEPGQPAEAVAGDTHADADEPEEQYLFVLDGDGADEAELDPEDDEDLDIPAFMRKRMQQR